MKLTRLLFFLTLLILSVWNNPAQVSGLYADQRSSARTPVTVGRQAGWNIQTVASDGSVGSYAQIALDSAGRPHIAYAYWDSENVSVGYAWWTGSAWSIETVDTEHWVGEGLSLALDAADEPHITYYDRSTGELKYAHRSGTIWQIVTVDDGGFCTSLALDGSGHPHIVYDGFDAGLKYAKWTRTGWIKTVLDADAPGCGSLTLDTADQPHVVYYRATPRDLVYAWWAGSAWETQIVYHDPHCDGGVLALDTGGEPHVAFCDHYPSNAGRLSLKYSHRVGGVWQTELADPDEDVGDFASLVIDADGRPHIAYHDKRFYDLKYSHWTGSAWSIERVDETGDVGWYASLAVDASGQPHIAYYDVTNFDLKYAHRPIVVTDLHKDAQPRRGVEIGQTVTYTLTLSGPGVSAQFSDPLPASVAYEPGSVTPPAVYDPTSRAIKWQGILSGTPQIIRFRVTAGSERAEGQSISPPIVNTAWLTDTASGQSISATVIVNGWSVYLPLLLRQY